jgi:hypothetical protein
MNEKRILILRSNVITLADLAQIRQPLDHHPGISHWNIDLDDCDHVLRIVTPELTVADIEAIIRQQGYQCSELE